MIKNDIKTKNDIFLLVNCFYTKVKADPVLGPIFKSIIKDWEAHTQQLTIFWEASLFLKVKYTGNPIQTHIDVDKNTNNSITQTHFGLWLNLWVQTVDQLYQGPYANNAKNKARKMSSYMFLKIFESRKDKHTK